MRPASQILVIWFFSKCLPPAFVCAFLTVWGFGLIGGLSAFATNSDSPSSFVTGLILAPISGIVVMLLALIYCVSLRQTYVYYVTNQRCVFRGGIILRRERSVPYHKITDVEISQNIIERALGIPKVNVFTPGTGSTTASPFGGQRAEISFVGLRDSESPAATINQILKKFKATGQ